MAKTLALLDSSYLYALSDRSDKYHERARAFARGGTVNYVLPDVVLTEVTYTLRKLIGKHAEIAFLKTQIRFPVQHIGLEDGDLQRVHAIMSQYTQFDFVDCCILALAERLNITRICTFDRRDFGLFKPTHCDYLELLP